MNRSRGAKHAWPTITATAPTTIARRRAGRGCGSAPDPRAAATMRKTRPRHVTSAFTWSRKRTSCKTANGLRRKAPHHEPALKGRDSKDSTRGSRSRPERIVHASFQHVVNSTGACRAEPHQKQNTNSAAAQVERLHQLGASFRHGRHVADASDLQERDSAVFCGERRFVIAPCAERLRPTRCGGAVIRDNLRKRRARLELEPGLRSERHA